MEDQKAFDVTSASTSSKHRALTQDSRRRKRAVDINRYESAPEDGLVKVCKCRLGLGMDARAVGGGGQILGAGEGMSVLRRRDSAEYIKNNKLKGSSKKCDN